MMCVNFDFGAYVFNAFKFAFKFECDIRSLMADLVGAVENEATTRGQGVVFVAATPSLSTWQRWGCRTKEVKEVGLRWCSLVAVPTDIVRCGDG
jgi:hypothetical protein